MEFLTLISNAWNEFLLIGAGLMVLSCLFAMLIAYFTEKTKLVGITLTAIMCVFTAVTSRLAFIIGFGLIAIKILISVV